MATIKWGFTVASFVLSCKMAEEGATVSQDLLVKIVMAKEGATVSQGLLVKTVVKTVTKRLKEAHGRFQFGIGEWVESSKDEKNT